MLFNLSLSTSCGDNFSNMDTNLQSHQSLFFYSAPLLVSNLFVVVVVLLESCIKSLVVVPTPVLGTK